MSKVKYTLGRGQFRTLQEGLEKEWLLTNGIGGLANSTVVGASNRMHNGYLTVSMNPPADRYTVLSNVWESVTIDGKEYDLAAQEYIGYEKKGYEYLNRFELDILPTYYYQVQDVTIKKTISLEYGKNTVVVCYEVENGMEEVSLHITPQFNCKPYGVTIEASQLQFDMTQEGAFLTLVPKEQDMNITFYASEGTYVNRSTFPTSMATPNYLVEENQVYCMDCRTGFMGVDNHFTPYDVVVDLQPFEEKKFYITCTIEKETVGDGFAIADQYKKRMHKIMAQTGEDVFLQKLAWAADAFVVQRKVVVPKEQEEKLQTSTADKVEGNTAYLKTILAGYPWFMDWGRDTMIAFQGLLLPTKRFKEARQILESFSWFVKDGMLPNVFPNSSKEEPRYNTIDAALWYFYSVYKYLEYTGEKEDYQFVEEKLYPAMEQIISYYKNGTHYGIKMDEDGLILGGSGKDQLTWMDVLVGDWVVTPRHGKAVEINALWYNALCVMEQLAERFHKDAKQYHVLAEKTKETFCEKFWNEEKGCLYDCIEKREDGIEIPDDRIRPNQIWAVSLPYTMLSRDREKAVVQTVYKHLYTPYGIRSLSPEDAEYKAHYIGKLIDRDGAYHMGTSWGYISGGFITAYCKVYEHSKKAVKKALEMCQYFSDHMQDGCLNGIAEIFDGDFSCTSRGCYTQAWSVGEVLRAYSEDVLPYLH